MNEIKSVVSVIKILERAIGILESCDDFGVIPNVTRKRVIEMLNKATLEIYFLNAQESKTSEEQIYRADQPSEQQPAETKSEWKAVTEEYMEEEIIEEEYIPEKESVPDEESVPNEDIHHFDEEQASEEYTIPEETIFPQQDYASDKPIIEWETSEPEPVKVAQETQEDEISKLKLQLAEERKRLEQELQNWQDEKRKKDEEISATKKLLDALQQQTALNQPQVQPQVRNQPQQSKPQQYQTPQVQPSQPVQPVQPVQTTRRFQQPQPFQQSQQSTASDPLIRKEEPVKKTARREESQESSTLIDRYIGSKKVLHENFESSNMVNQLSTPVSSLSKVIGINDKFRFIKELFGGDSDLYNETIRALDTKGSLVAAISYIESNFSWDKNNDSVKQLISLIRRRYM